MMTMSTVHILVSVDGYGINGKVALDTEYYPSEWNAFTVEEQEQVARNVYSENTTWGWHVATPNEIEQWS